MVEGGSVEGRLANWEKHFKKLLGQSPSVPCEDIFIESVHPLQDDIETGDFTVAELEEARSKISEGKAGGDDGIMPEVLKRVDMNEIILKFCN